MTSAQPQTKTNKYYGVPVVHESVYSGTDYIPDEERMQDYKEYDPRLSDDLECPNGYIAMRGSRASMSAKHSPYQWHRPYRSATYALPLAVLKRTLEIIRKVLAKTGYQKMYRLNGRASSVWPRWAPQMSSLTGLVKNRLEDRHHLPHQSIKAIESNLGDGASLWWRVKGIPYDVVRDGNDLILLNTDKVSVEELNCFLALLGAANPNDALELSHIALMNRVKNYRASHAA